MQWEVQTRIIEVRNTPERSTVEGEGDDQLRMNIANTSELTSIFSNSALRLASRLYFLV